jgi:Pyridoxamine 5'-phosphate oxidase
MTWLAFAAGAPEMAELAKEQFAQSGMALIGTIRRDGSPRINCVEPCILDGALYLGMMWQSRKALDLLSDPRLVIHNAICSNTGDERELSLRGRAQDMHDPQVRLHYVGAVERTSWKGADSHLFAVAIESAALVTYGNGEQSVEVWPQGTMFKRPYG